MTLEKLILAKQAFNVRCHHHDGMLSFARNTPIRQPTTGCRPGWRGRAQCRAIHRATGTTAARCPPRPAQAIQPNRRRRWRHSGLARVFQLHVSSAHQHHQLCSQIVALFPTSPHPRGPMGAPSQQPDTRWQHPPNVPRTAHVGSVHGGWRRACIRLVGGRWHCAVRVEWVLHQHPARPAPLHTHTACGTLGGCSTWQRCVSLVVHGQLHVHTCGAPRSS